MEGKGKFGGHQHRRKPKIPEPVLIVWFHPLSMYTEEGVNGPLPPHKHVYFYYFQASLCTLDMTNKFDLYTVLLIPGADPYLSES